MKLLIFALIFSASFFSVSNFSFAADSAPVPAAATALSTTTTAATNSSTTTSVFKLHIFKEPGNLDPQLQKSSNSSYLLGNLFRNLFTFDDEKGLLPDLGESCKYIAKKTLTCKIKKDLKWSDGSPLTSKDFLNTYQKILNPKNKVTRANLLFHIKNATDIYKGNKPTSSLGITAPNATTLKFEFADSDPDFEYNLSNFILAPTKEDLNISSGPYKLREWKKGQSITLEPNNYYVTKNPNRPLVEFFFIEEDTVALQLYEKEELSFLRRLPTLFIPKYKERKDFFWIPVSRFDYIGFGPELKDAEDLRKAFTYSLNYPELQKIFSAQGVPGCAGIPDSWFPDKAPCFVFDTKKIPAVKSDKTYTLAFSSQGGEDHKRATEWMQDQWLKNAGLKTQLQMRENKVYLQELESNPPPLFRRGVAPDRPTCLATLETFESSSPENYIHVNSKEYDENLKALGEAKTESERKKLCLQGVSFLMDHHLLIPLGPIHFAILAKTKFSGWKMNQMNQLDLSGLHTSP